MIVRNLDHEITTGQAFRSDSDAAGSVQCLGTTAPQAKLLGNSEWTADLEYVWRSRVAEPIAKLHARARRRRRQAAATPDDCPRLRVVALRSAEWAEHRARALAMARADVLDACGKRWRSVRCGCRMVELKVGCDQPQLCADCRRKHCRKWSQRITLGIDRALRDERAAFYRMPRCRRRGMRPGVYLITLTGPHSGDFGTDRDAMGRAVRKLLKHATKYGWWSTYALTWEATSGVNGEGHLHVHMAVISSWIPYSSSDVEEGSSLSWCPRRKGERRDRAMRGLHQVWRDALPGAEVLDVKAPRSGADDASTAAWYLAKYVTKGVDPIEFTGRKAGELLVAFRGRRKVSTSEDFYPDPITECECCGEAWQSLGAPISLQTLLPGAVLRSMSERTKWRWSVLRGPPQVGLRWQDASPQSPVLVC